MADSDNNGLASIKEVEALADQLAQCADELHARILADLKSHGDAQPSDADMGAARSLFNDELVLRQRANSLYADAARSVVKGLGQSQQNVAALTAAAAEKIRKIAVIQDVTGLVGGLLQLAGAAATGNPVPIVAALEKVRKQVKSLDAHTAAKPA
jgi:hypothetical protein